MCVFSPVPNQACPIVAKTERLRLGSYPCILEETIPFRFAKDHT